MAALAPDDWLSQAAGFACLRLDADAELSAGWAAQAPRPVAFVFCKIPVQHVERAKAISAVGFYVVDTNVTMVWIGAAPDEAAPEGIEIAVAGPEDHEQAQGIAGSAFVYSRFHLDPIFPAEAANRIKREWIRSYCEGRRGECLLVARQGRRVTGFLAVLGAEVGGKTAAVIDLIAVDSGSRGQGVGAALVRHFVRRWCTRAEVLRVGTQIANAASLRLYQRCGFSMVDASYVLHAHVRDGKLL